jgi:hypothetical protein
MDGLDAVGDAVTGGLLAHSVEPRTGEGDGYTHEKSCLNCGTKLTGAYCSACGQRAHVHRSVRAFFQDFFVALFNFEGKVWRTLPMLAWKPGDMTRRYIAGERARFISPVALYLFTVFAMFAVLNFNGALDSSGPSKNLKVGLNSAVTEQQQELGRLEMKRGIEAAAGKDVGDLDNQIGGLKEAIRTTQNLGVGNSVAPPDVNAKVPKLLRPFIKHVKDNPQLVSMKVQDAASKFSWLLIPISVPFLWLLFPFSRRFNTYDHTVFITYSLSFMMLLVVFGGLFMAAGMTTIASLLFFVPPFHMYKHLKGAYQLRRFSAVMRTLALVTFAFIAFGLFAAATVAIGAS